MNSIETKLPKPSIRFTNNQGKLILLASAVVAGAVLFARQRKLRNRQNLLDEAISRHTVILHEISRWEDEGGQIYAPHDYSAK